MKQIVDEIAKKLRDALKDAISDFEGLYVFGSQVRGDATEDSDLDIVVLFGHERFYQPDAFYEILSKMRYDYYDVIDLDIHPKTHKQLENNPIFYNEVVNRGVFYGSV
ncbi:MAG: nucleotidyltransferase domain-containing protein [Heliobacteriaceae bacterium]|jgi:predicted nucleotidyltransferase|nr:nucleotidyltransferase domain-containing protein [Heliobacteriaceae bacterium]